MTNELAIRTVDTSEWALMRDQAKALVPTGFLPDAIKTPEQALAVMLKGRELGIPPMYALSNITVIKGKPSANAELMLALIYRDHGDDAVWFPESTTTACTITYKRRNWAKRKEFTFTIEDAARAGLSQQATWKSYPAALLRARCISAVARMAFPDSIGGMYTPEELGAAVIVSDDGEITPETQTAQVDAETGEIAGEPKPTAPPERTPEEKAERNKLRTELAAHLQSLGLEGPRAAKWIAHYYKTGDTRELTTEQLREAVTQAVAELDVESEAGAQEVA